MAGYWYERLSNRCADFLANEQPRAFAHAASIQIFEAGPLATEEGGVDFQAIRKGIDACLHRVPRLRQELLWIPLENHPVWVDDGDFNLAYHLRHTSLPRPGGFAQLEAMAARIMAQRLDRSRPLWECWVLEGLNHGRFALILKTHHCLADEADADLLEALLSPDPEADYEETPPWNPRPRPSARELVTEEIVRQARLPRRVVERAGTLLGDTERLGHELTTWARSTAEMLGYSLRHPVETPLNGRIGPHRLFRGVPLPLDEARSIRRALDGSMLDVILATVAGAARDFLTDRLVNPAALDFRISTPVALASGGSGERVGEWIIDLPVWEKDPASRFRRIQQETTRLGEVQGPFSASTMVQGQAWFGGRILSLGARALASHTPVNMTITSAPGAQIPLYFKGARLLETYGQVPLREHHGLGIAVMSYDGQLFFGLNADFDLVPDVDRFAAALVRSFRELRWAAGRTPEEPLEAP